MCSLYTNSCAFHKTMTTFSHQDVVIGEISKLTKYLKFIFCICFQGLPKMPYVSMLHVTLLIEIV